MSFLFFLVVPSVVDFLLSSPTATHGIGRMLQSIDGTIPLPNMSAPTVPDMDVTTSPPDDINDLLPGFNISGSNFSGINIDPDDIDPDLFNHDEEDVQQALNMEAKMLMIKSVVFGVIHILILCVWSACYKSKVTDRRHSFPSPVPPQYSLKKDAFPFGTFACFEDCDTCAFGFFCQPCRLGDTMTQVGASSFWKMVTAYILGCPLAVMLQNILVADQLNKFIAQIGGTNSAMMSDDEVEHSLSSSVTRMQMACWIPRLLWIAMCLLLAVERKKLRRNLGGKGKNNLCMDFCCYCWCFCCTLIQDARTVDGAADTAVQCPCRLVRLNKVDAVGEPVSVSEEESDYSSDSN